MSVDAIKQVVVTYGLRDFPFEVRELNPLADERDLEEVCWVDGWQDARALDDFLGNRAQAGQPALVVVAGGSGTGRSSLVNWLLHAWARHRGVDAPNLIVARKRAENLHAEEQLWQWSLGFEPPLMDAGLRMSPPTESAFNNLLAQKPAAVGPAVRRFLALLAADLEQRGVALAGVVKAVEGPSFLPLAAECIAGVNILLVLTVVAHRTTEAEVLGDARKLLDPAVGRLVRLRELSGAEVTTVVRNRWTQHANAGHPSPFSDQALEAAFDHPRRSMRDVLMLMTALLASKALGAKDRWPDAQSLAFDEDELVQRMPLVDGSWLRM